MKHIRHMRHIHLYTCAGEGKGDFEFLGLQANACAGSADVPDGQAGGAPTANASVSRRQWETVEGDARLTRPVRFEGGVSTGIGSDSGCSTGFKTWTRDRIRICRTRTRTRHAR